MSPYRTPAPRPSEPSIEPIDPWFTFCMDQADTLDRISGYARDPSEEGVSALERKAREYRRQALPITPLWRRVLGL